MRIIRGKRFDSVSNTESTWAVMVMVVHCHQCRERREEYAVLVNVSPRTDLTWLAIIK